MIFFKRKEPIFRLNFLVILFVYYVLHLQLIGLFIEPEQYSSMHCLVVLLFIVSDCNFSSAFITKQKSTENPCNKIIKFMYFPMNICI